MPDFDPGRRKICDDCENQVTTRSMFPADGVWLVTQKGNSSRRIAGLPGELEMSVLVVLEMYRDEIVGAAKEIMEKHATTGISAYDGASIVIEAVEKAQREKREEDKRIF